MCQSIRSLRLVNILLFALLLLCSSGSWAGASSELSPGQVTVLLTFAPIYFKPDMTRCYEGEMVKIKQLVSTLENHPEIKLRLIGHTGERGSADYNLKIAMRRASFVRDQLVDLGIAAKRLRVISAGESQPADPEHTPAAYLKNTRVEIAIAEF